MVVRTLDMEPDARTPPTQDDAIRTLVARLARPNDQGHVIERAAIMAAGSQSAAIEAWIVAHAGRPEPIESDSPAPSGLHGDRQTSASSGNRTPLRFLIPAGVL